MPAPLHQRDPYMSWDLRLESSPTKNGAVIACDCLDEFDAGLSGAQGAKKSRIPFPTGGASSKGRGRKNLSQTLDTLFHYEHALAFWQCSAHMADWKCSAH